MLEQVDIATTARRVATVFALLAVSLLALGAIGHLAVFDSQIGEAESDLVQWLADHRVGVIDRVAETGSALTDTWTVLGVLLGATTVLVATDRIRLAVAFVLAMTIEITVFLLVGAIIDRSRPAVEALDSVPSTASFPSGHIAAAVIIYGFLAFVLRTVGPRRVPPTIWLFAGFAVLTVGAARLYEGVHYPSDLFGGALLGVGSLAAGLYVADVDWPRSDSTDDDNPDGNRGDASRASRDDVETTASEADVGATT